MDAPVRPDLADPDRALIDEAWDAPPHRPSALDSAPVLSVEGFEGPLDWLLALVRAQRIDLATMSILALVDAFGAALDQALRQAEITPAVLARWGDWLVMAADLALLRSRLLLTADAAETRTVRDQAETLRRQLVRGAEMRAAADWLEQRPQLGRDVFGRGQAGDARRAKGGRTGGGDVTALLRACLVALRLPADAAVRYRVPAAPFWTMGDAVSRIRHLLPTLGEDGGESGMELGAFLPHVPEDAPDRALRCRAAVASTFLGGLELARDGTVSLQQNGAFLAISIRAAAVVADRAVVDGLGG